MRGRLFLAYYAVRNVIAGRPEAYAFWLASFYRAEVELNAYSIPHLLASVGASVVARA